MKGAWYREGERKRFNISISAWFQKLILPLTAVNHPGKGKADRQGEGACHSPPLPGLITAGGVILINELTWGWKG